MRPCIQYSVSNFRVSTVLTAIDRPGDNVFNDGSGSNPDSLVGEIRKYGGNKCIKYFLELKKIKCIHLRTKKYEGVAKIHETPFFLDLRGLT